MRSYPGGRVVPTTYGHTARALTPELEDQPSTKESVVCTLAPKLPHVITEIAHNKHATLIKAQTWTTAQH